MGRDVTGYDIGVLTPAGPGHEHVDGVLETEASWLLVHRDNAQGPVVKAWPAHAVWEVTICDGGTSCAGR